MRVSTATQLYKKKTIIFVQISLNSDLIVLISSVLSREFLKPPRTHQIYQSKHRVFLQRIMLFLNKARWIAFTDTVKTMFRIGATE